MALVSIVTATYAGDDPQFLAQAIDSVIDQTHRPLQYLIAGDGPLPDVTRALIDARVSDHDWIELCPLPGPRGPAATRNEVLARCRGDYVAILDADDAMVPTRVSEQVRYLTEHGLDVVASWLEVMDPTGTEVGVRKFPETAAEVTAKAPFFCPTANTAVLFRRAVLPDFRYPKLAVGEDYRLWVDLLRRGRRIGNVPRPLTRYRTGSGYFSRRRGWSYATSDLATKLRALPLAVWWQRPVVVGVAGATFAVRLLPASWFRSAYAVFEKVTRR